MKLSIIISYYEVYDLIIKLLDVLIPQIQENVLRSKYIIIILEKIH